jgi:hypothetical protein
MATLGLSTGIIAIMLIDEQQLKVENRNEKKKKDP